MRAPCPIQQFLAENTNRRTDRYGSSRNGRLLLAIDIVTSVAAAVGADRVGLRISPDNPENEIAEQDPQGTHRALLDTTFTLSSVASTPPLPTCAHAGRAR
ncbi:hypothetical protein [Nocardia sp. NPDC019395]|uniref:oxidoreductase n=1 Tax=Nocardia sp. NPDC019395 TaxID=3154686 RepID=UPI0033D3CEAE